MRLNSEVKLHLNSTSHCWECRSYMSTLLYTMLLVYCTSHNFIHSVWLLANLKTELLGSLFLSRVAPAIPTNDSYPCSLGFSWFFSEWDEGTRASKRRTQVVKRREINDSLSPLRGSRFSHLTRRKIKKNLWDRGKWLVEFQSNFTLQVSLVELLNFTFYGFFSFFFTARYKWKTVKYLMKKWRRNDQTTQISNKSKLHKRPFPYTCADLTLTFLQWPPLQSGNSH